MHQNAVDSRHQNRQQQDDAVHCHGDGAVQQVGQGVGQISLHRERLGYGGAQQEGKLIAPKGKDEDNQKRLGDDRQAQGKGDLPKTADGAGSQIFGSLAQCPADTAHECKDEICHKRRLFPDISQYRPGVAGGIQQLGEGSMVAQNPQMIAEP